MENSVHNYGLGSLAEVTYVDRYDSYRVIEPSIGTVPVEYSLCIQ